MVLYWTGMKDKENNTKKNKKRDTEKGLRNI